MMATVVDGRAIAAKMGGLVRIELEKLRVKPRLAILCPDFPVARMYMGAQKRLADSLGIEVEALIVTVGTDQSYVESAVRFWNSDRRTHGIFILQPFLPEIDLARLTALIDPIKDIECIHPYDRRLSHFSGKLVGSCTALAVMEILESSGVYLYGREVVVVGNSKIVGTPLALLLLERFATVTVCHKATAEVGNLLEHIARAEILVVAVGVPELIKGDSIRQNAVVVDVGVNHVDGRVVGDVDFAGALDRVQLITPAIGGVGPVTAMVGMRQLVTACRLQFEGR